MDKEYLIPLLDSGIVRLEEYYYSKPLDEEEVECVDCAVMYINEFEVIMTNCKFKITIKDTYTIPEFTLIDLLILINDNSNYIKELSQLGFMSWLRHEVIVNKKNRDVCEIKFEREMI